MEVVELNMEVISKTPPLGLWQLPRREVLMTYTGVLLAMFLASLDQTIVGTAMPRIITDLAGFSHYTWVTSAYVMASAVVIPITGRLTDMYGRKPFYLVGLAIFILSSFVCGFSRTMTQLIILRGIQGVGAGIIMSNSFTVIGDLFSPAERGKYQGITSGVFGLSSIIGPTLGGFITDTWSWHWVFFINIPLGITIILLFSFFFPNIRPAHGKHHLDYLGLITLILTIVPAMLALTWSGVKYPWLSVRIIGMCIFALCMLAVFIVVEKRSKEPIIPLDLFRNQIVIISDVILFLTGFGMFGGIIFIPLFFQGVLGTSATVSGNFLTPMMLGMIVGSFASGQLLSRVGGHYRFQGAIGIAIMSLGMLLLTQMTAQTGYSTAVINLIVTGLGLGITMPLYTIAVQNAVPYSYLGVATSSTAFFRSIGGSVGLAVLGSVMNHRFTSELMDGLPMEIKSVMPAKQLAALANNPQVLIGAGALDQLSEVLKGLEPQGVELLEQLLLLLKQSLASAISQVFLVGLCFLLIALVISFFIREIPLRKQHVVSDSLPNIKSMEKS